MSRFRSALTALRHERLAPAAPLVAAGRFNRAAIMRRACQLARAEFRNFGSWSKRMSLGLTAAWRQARVEMAAPAPVALRPIAIPLRAEAPRAKVTIYDRHIRAFSHGW